MTSWRLAPIPIYGDGLQRRDWIHVADCSAAIGLFLGCGWSHWPSVLGAAFVVLQGTAYVGWNLVRGIGPIGVVCGLLEPVLAMPRTVGVELRLSF